MMRRVSRARAPKRCAVLVPARYRAPLPFWSWRARRRGGARVRVCGCGQPHCLTSQERRSTLSTASLPFPLPTFFFFASLARSLYPACISIPSPPCHATPCHCISTKYLICRKSHPRQPRRPRLRRPAVPPHPRPHPQQAQRNLLEEEGVVVPNAARLCRGVIDAASERDALHAHARLSLFKQYGRRFERASFPSPPFPPRQMAGVEVRDSSTTCKVSAEAARVGCRGEANAGRWGGRMGGMQDNMTSLSVFCFVCVVVDAPCSSRRGLGWGGWVVVVVVGGGLAAICDVGIAAAWRGTGGSPLHTTSATSFGGTQRAGLEDDRGGGWLTCAAGQEALGHARGARRGELSTTSPDSYPSSSCSQCLYRWCVAQAHDNAIDVRVRIWHRDTESVASGGFLVGGLPCEDHQ